MLSLELTSDRWYALHVRSRHEKIVFAQLDAKQHNVFFPVYSARHKWADRWKTVLLPLFPGYVFCRFDVAKRSSVLTTSGVIGIVGAGTRPVPVETSEIEAIQWAVKSPLFTEPFPDLVRGQRVVMTGGPLTGLTGTLMEIRRNLRLVLSVELLQRSVLVEIEREWVAVCEPVKSACHGFISSSNTHVA